MNSSTWGPLDLSAFFVNRSPEISFTQACFCAHVFVLFFTYDLLFL